MLLLVTDIRGHNFRMMKKKTKKIADTDTAHTDEINASALLKIFTELFGISLTKRKRITALRNMLTVHEGIVASFRFFGKLFLLHRRRRRRFDKRRDTKNIHHKTEHIAVSFLDSILLDNI